MDNNQIIITGVTKTYERKIILDHVGLTLEKGGMYAIAGRNGCGKTTLLSILAGANRADAGEISFFGIDPTRERKAFGRLCGYVPQENPLMEELTARDNLRLWASWHQIHKSGVVKRFELKEIARRPVKKLSGGTKRRLAIACALAAGQRILLLDEPSSSLDIYYRGKILADLRAFAEAGGTVLMSTHDRDELEACRTCFLMRSYDETTPEIPQIEAMSAQEVIRVIMGADAPAAT